MYVVEVALRSYAWCLFFCLGVSMDSLINFLEAAVLIVA